MSKKELTSTLKERCKNRHASESEHKSRRGSTVRRLTVQMLLNTSSGNRLVSACVSWKDITLLSSPRLPFQPPTSFCSPLSYPSAAKNRGEWEVPAEHWDQSWILLCCFVSCGSDAEQVLGFFSSSLNLCFFPSTWKTSRRKSSVQTLKGALILWDVKNEQMFTK